MISEITIGYDWDTLNNVAEIKLVSSNGVISLFKIIKLTEYSLSEDFSASYIIQQRAFSSLNRFDNKFA
jgi:hypothetical protein